MLQSKIDPVVAKTNLCLQNLILIQTQPMWKKVNFQLLSVIQLRHGKEIRKKKPRTQKRPHEFLCFVETFITSELQS